MTCSLIASSRAAQKELTLFFQICLLQLSRIYTQLAQLLYAKSYVS